MAPIKRPTLPKSVLDMKFMKKTKERLQKELENVEDHESLYANVITNEMKHASGNYIAESSFIFCEDLLEGRLSFKGMNPEIERLMELEKKPDINDEEDMKKDVSDELLANKMNKFNRKRNSSPSKYSIIKKKR
ncbi:M-phase phosphoprotein 6 [Colias croceus]|uniref:M-phase phosphoprotein 6 n=1 Tax=Colias crocea TaxID=72248 RepID=UPI001E27A4CC|nr:M-phase phosphoprotein 6 [Colias croceus]CAG4944863.1 unnamed protein product [Colias eurytheme]